jgi:hypothetical protein
MQSARHSTSYDLRDNNRRTPTSRDALQSARFSTSHDPRDKNRRAQILEMSYYQRDSQLVMIQETTTEAPKAAIIKKGKP